MNFNVSWDAITEKDNVLTIENITPRAKGATPLTYYINYAVFKAPVKKGNEKKDDGALIDGLMK